LVVDCGGLQAPETAKTITNANKMIFITSFNYFINSFATLFKTIICQICIQC
jgi:hypothetical protein